jgi:pyruvate/2-oxoglutarate dehydrogenase complex dihydrolipoamide acyltransferase (E2) component
MICKVVLSPSGMGIEEGTIVRWLKAVGDPVSEGEVVVEVETAKAVQEIEAPASGVFSAILTPEGETVPVGTEIAEIEEG